MQRLIREPRFLRTSEAARFLALSARMPEKHRCYGTGPKYRKLGGRVIYGLADLKAKPRRSDPRREIRSLNREPTIRSSAAITFQDGLAAFPPHNLLAD